MASQWKITMGVKCCKFIYIYIHFNTVRIRKAIWDYFFLTCRAVDVKWLLSEITLPPLHPRATCKVFADTGITDVGGAAVNPPKIYISSMRFLQGLPSQAEVLRHSGSLECVSRGSHNNRRKSLEAHQIKHTELGKEQGGHSVPIEKLFLAYSGTQS